MLEDAPDVTLVHDEHHRGHGVVFLSQEPAGRLVQRQVHHRGDLGQALALVLVLALDGRDDDVLRPHPLSEAAATEEGGQRRAGGRVGVGVEGHLGASLPCLLDQGYRLLRQAVVGLAAGLVV